MGIAERLFDGLRATIELRSDVDRLSEQLRSVSTDVLDHERRLIRIETMIEMSQNGERRSRRIERPSDQD